MTRSKICGFRRASLIDQADREWEDENFAMFSLVLVSSMHAKHIPIEAGDIQLRNGWEW